MKYVGSKRRYIKEILPLILSNREKGQYYVEPFVGGFNVMEHVNGNRIAACLLYTSPSPRDRQKSRMPSSA